MRSRLVFRYLILSVTLWVCGVATSFLLNITQENQFTEEMAALQARTVYEKDVLYRLWSSIHGGVYVPKTDQTPPNQYIDESLREVETTTGKFLVLLSPTFITRQVYELQKENLNILGHIASLNPTRPENAPDEWERKSLEVLTSGTEEITSIEIIDGEYYLRLMRPLITRETCISCHEDDQVGVIKGGVSVAVPMEPFWQVSVHHQQSHLVGHLILLVLGLIGIAIAVNRVAKRIRERDQFENELIRSRDKQANIAHQLAETNEELEAFAYTVSHDLRAPLRRIYGYICLIRDRDKPEAQSKESILFDRVGENVAKMDNLVETILRFSRLTRGELERKEVDLSLLVHSIASELRHEQPDRLVDFIIEDDVRADGDAQLLRVVLENLIGNAWKFSEKKEKTEIRFGTVNTKDGSQVLFVEDNGIGFSPDDADKLFTPFQRLRQEEGFEGEGIGLATVRRIIHRHGGRIWAESRPAEGSTFFFTLE